MAIVDEADAILIDEARNPLVLAGNLPAPPQDHHRIAQVVAHLSKGKDFESDEAATNIYLTDLGRQAIQEKLQIEDLTSAGNLALYSAVNLALQARELLQRDVQYVLKDGAVKLVDEFTGRIVEDRKWRNGLQTAVEAKEGLEIRSEGGVLNSISIQHLIRRYHKIAAMTATAQASAEEFEQFYGLRTVVIPPNRPCLRTDLPDLIFTNRQAKHRALIQEIKAVHKTGQPILIGTLHVRESENWPPCWPKKALHAGCSTLKTTSGRRRSLLKPDASMP